ncbi:MAG: small permease of tripartite tricarboxylate transporter [Herminiimonas sp.]|nr:small permease of tripartite tricarboxylate transporter [Herminiimonas sp.]
MNMNTSPEPPEVPGESDAAITHRTVELVVGVLLTLVGVLVMWSNYQLGAGWADDGPQSGYFPFRLGIVIFLSSLVVIVQAVIKADRSAFVEKEQLKLVAIVLLPLILYVASIQSLGIYVPSALFIGIFMMAVGKFSWWKAIAVSVGTTLVIFWIFELQFQVPLPKGPLEQLFGY